MEKQIEKQLEVIVKKGLGRNWFDRLPLMGIGLFSALVGVLFLIVASEPISMIGFLIGMVLFFLCPIASIFQSGNRNLKSQNTKGVWIAGIFHEKSE